MVERIKKETMLIFLDVFKINHRIFSSKVLNNDSALQNDRGFEDLSSVINFNRSLFIII